jgi:hypothetical protein
MRLDYNITGDLEESNNEYDAEYASPETSWFYFY